MLHYYVVLCFLPLAGSRQRGPQLRERLALAQGDPRSQGQQVGERPLACMNMYVYIYIYIERERERDMCVCVCLYVCVCMLLCCIFIVVV